MTDQENSTDDADDADDSFDIFFLTPAANTYDMATKLREANQALLYQNSPLTSVTRSRKVTFREGNLESYAEECADGGATDELSSVTDENDELCWGQASPPASKASCEEESNKDFEHELLESWSPFVKDDAKKETSSPKRSRPKSASKTAYVQKGGVPDKHAEDEDTDEENDPSIFSESVDEEGILSDSQEDSISMDSPEMHDTLSCASLPSSDILEISPCQLPIVPSPPQSPFCFDDPLSASSDNSSVHCAPLPQLPSPTKLPNDTAPSAPIDTSPNPLTTPSRNPPDNLALSRRINVPDDPSQSPLRDSPATPSTSRSLDPARKSSTPEPSSTYGGPRFEATKRRPRAKAAVGSKKHLLTSKSIAPTHKQATPNTKPDGSTRDQTMNTAHVSPRKYPSSVRSCCSESRRPRLPTYNGLHSEYGLSAEQLQERRRAGEAQRNARILRQQEHEAERIARRRHIEALYKEWLRLKNLQDTRVSVQKNLPSSGDQIPCPRLTAAMNRNRQRVSGSSGTGSSSSVGAASSNPSTETSTSGRSQEFKRIRYTNRPSWRRIADPSIVTIRDLIRKAPPGLLAACQVYLGLTIR